MEPSGVLKLFRQYLRHPDESRRYLRYWIGARNPKYNTSNGVVLFVTFLGFLTLIVASISWAANNYWLLAIPAGIGIVFFWVRSVLWAQGKDHGLTEKFKTYRQQRWRR